MGFSILKHKGPDNTLSSLLSLSIDTAGRKLEKHPMSKRKYLGTSNQQKKPGHSVPK